MWVSNGGADAIVKYSIDPAGKASAEYIEHMADKVNLKMPQGIVVEQVVADGRHDVDQLNK